MRFPSILLLGAFCAASPALAQQVGTYTGTTQDGSAVTIIVATDPNTSKLEVKSFSFGVDMLCQKSMETLSDVGIGLGDGFDIAGDGTFSYATSGFFDIDLVTSMTFKGTKSVKGKVGANLAAFVPAIGHTKLTSKVQPCVSATQPFTATFSGADVSRTLPAGMLSIHGPGGTATIRREN